MATSTQLRSWWAPYKCTESRYVRVNFPGVGRSWPLQVARESAPIWLAVAQIMTSEPYLFRESAGGTYNCRPISGTQVYSLHAYGLALDINPSANPHKIPLTHDYPATFITRMEGITANGKRAITWGGRWAKPDAMHWQIDVSPDDVVNVEWDKGDGLPPLTEKEENFVKEFLASMEAAGLGTLTSRRARMDKVVAIGGNYPTTPSSGSGGVSEAEVKQIIASTHLDPP